MSGEKNVEYVAGLDGGGTKTAVAVCDLQGKPLGRFTEGATNFNGASAESVGESLSRIFAELERTRGLENCRAICLGAAGAGNPEVRGELEKRIRLCGFRASLLVTGDHRTALYGALGGSAGLIVIAGTGSICHGRNSDGEERRAGGYGYRIDDAGSGYDIGRGILSAAARADDGRSDPTALTGLLFESLKTDGMDGVVRRVYDGKTGKREIAALAPLLTRACGLGDETALKIADRCGGELFRLAVPVVEGLGLRKETAAFAGSILKKDPYVRKALSERLARAYPDLRQTDPRGDAAFGAAQMALALVVPKPRP